MSQYSEMLERYDTLYELNNTNKTDWQKVLFVVDGHPVEALRQFETLADAEILIQGNSEAIPGKTFYDVYPGALLSVLDDSTNTNNGLYHVIYDTSDGSRSSYKLNKIYDASTVDSLISSHSGSITIQSVDTLNDSSNNISIDDEEDEEPGERSESELSEQEGEDKAKLLYFVGTDSSISTQPDISTLYFTDTIAYDSTGTLFTRENMQSSDIRLKDNIKQLDIDLNTLSEIEKISFAWKATPNKKTIGVSAQSVEKVFPELVYENPTTGFKSVNYEALTAVALAAIDKLNVKVNTLESIITEMKQGK